jgi:hypothetical protein
MSPAADQDEFGSDVLRDVERQIDALKASISHDLDEWFPADGVELYHGTRGDYLPSIFDEGLRIGGGGRVWLTTNLGLATHYAYWRVLEYERGSIAHVGDGVVLRIQGVADHELGSVYTSKDPIPPSRIVVHEMKPIPLKTRTKSCPSCGDLIWGAVMEYHLMFRCEGEWAIVEYADTRQVWARR